MMRDALLKMQNGFNRFNIQIVHEISLMQAAGKPELRAFRPVENKKAFFFAPIFGKFPSGIVYMPANVAGTRSI